MAATPAGLTPADTEPTVTTVDPATGGVLARYPAHGQAQVEQLLARAAAAAPVWAATPLAQRLDLLRQVGRVLSERREEYARLITAEMGKPLAQARAEIDKCAWNCTVVADQAATWLADRPVDGPGARSWVTREPLGVVLAIMPWNFPFWQVLRFACAALAAGNVAVLKHSPNVTGCALTVEDLFAAAGAPPGLFAALVLAEADVPATVAALVADPRVAAVTLTGSERAGQAVAAASGGALKKVVLELGGSDPLVVLDDADLSVAAAAAVTSRFGNAGQSCIAAKRIIVVNAVAEEFLELFAARVARLRVGDPAVEGTDLGPMARADLREALHDQVGRSVAAGVVLVAGGHPGDGAGYYYPPTILDRVGPGTACFEEETFGPVAAVVRARDDEHAVELADATGYGLGAAVWGEREHALAVGRRIRSGALFVNAVVASDPRLPFGGIGRSGFGRELSVEGTLEFTNARSVVLGDHEAPPPSVTE